MSTFESGGYRWRETYFLLFDSAQRPTVERMQNLLEGLPGKLDLQNLRADDDGRFDSVTVVAPGTYSALDISYLEGEEVLEQAAEFLEQFQDANSTSAEQEKLKRISACDSRFDILHFEEVVDEEDEMFDPSALLLVVEALTELTEGVGVDPQSGTIM